MTVPILIVGGGIGGFAAALALAQRGYSVEILEAGAAFGEVGAGIQIGPNAFRMFDRLGITSAINDVAVFPDALVMRDAHTGDAVTTVPLLGAFEKRYPYPYGVIHRPDLHAVLMEAALATGRVTARTGAKVVRYEQDAAGVTAVLEHGATRRGLLLLGADGLWSRIRQQMLGDGSPRVSGHIAYRAVLPIETVPEHLRRDRVTLWAGPKTHLVHYPLHRGELMNLVVVFHSDRYEEGWDVAGDADELTRRFEGQHPDVLDMLAKVETWRMWVLCDREPVKGWTDGRVALLGDAAHPMLQYLAQGACMAMEDGVCLAKCLTDAPDDPAAALARYAEARYLRTGRVQLTARFYGDVYHASGVTAELRNKMLAGRSPEQAAEGMAWLYDGIDDDGFPIR